MSKLINPITSNISLPIQNNLRTITKMYQCKNQHGFSVAWVDDGENETIEWECPICAMFQVVTKYE